MGLGWVPGAYSLHYRDDAAGQVDTGFSQQVSLESRPRLFIIGQESGEGKDEVVSTTLGRDWECSVEELQDASTVFFAGEGYSRAVQQRPDMIILAMNLLRRLLESVEQLSEPAEHAVATGGTESGHPGCRAALG